MDKFECNRNVESFQFFLVELEFELKSVKLSNYHNAALESSINASLRVITNLRVYGEFLTKLSLVILNRKKQTATVNLLFDLIY